MLFYTIINIFITLLENVNKSRTSAGSLSLNIIIVIKQKPSKPASKQTATSKTQQPVNKSSKRRRHSTCASVNSGKMIVTTVLCSFGAPDMRCRSSDELTGSRPQHQCNMLFLCCYLS
jgi:hypothetical protein